MGGGGKVSATEEAESGPTKFVILSANRRNRETRVLPHMKPSPKN